jgi:hypothetical protein
VFQRRVSVVVPAVGHDDALEPDRTRGKGFEFEPTVRVGDSLKGEASMEAMPTWTSETESTGFDGGAWSLTDSGHCPTRNAICPWCIPSSESMASTWRTMVSSN